MSINHHQKSKPERQLYRSHELLASRIPPNSGNSYLVRIQIRNRNVYKAILLNYIVGKW